jgi:hypothetical protein
LCAIELREVAQEPVESISDWFAMQEFNVRRLRSKLLDMRAGLVADVSRSRYAAEGRAPSSRNCAN